MNPLCPVKVGEVHVAQRLARNAAPAHLHALPAMGLAPVCGLELRSCGGWGF